ncbi:MAG: hypothetical protein JNK40_02800 [Chromatiales bacterium]|nr:hypothetical protein [Chromatiales bacterium]
MIRLRPAWTNPLAAMAACGLALVSAGSLADYRADVGYTRLQQELGGALPDGAGVVVSQIEGVQSVYGQDAWMPDITDGEFAGKTILNVSNATAGLYSGHATGVATDFYGLTSSMAPAITSISAYAAFDWMGPRYLATTYQAAGGPTPVVSTSRIANHSWVASAPGLDTYVLRRLDWVIETDEFIHVAGLNNGNGSSPSASALLTSAFNVIAVGRSSGQHDTGTAAVDGIYTAGRARPHIVAPGNSTSLSTPHVAAAAALLVATGHANAVLSSDPVSVGMTNRAGVVVRNAERSTVVKAALMAGADRVTHNSSEGNLGIYRDVAGNRTANGLDRRYGAGQLNVRNSYLIIAAGEQGSGEDGGPASSVATRGFDYDPAFGGASGSNATATYLLPVSAQPQLLTAALVWNIDVTGPVPPGMGFDTSATLHNLDLLLIDLAAGGATVAASQGTADNTENLWVVVPANAQYALRVIPAGTFSRDYGLAWQLLPDADGDGAPDERDNCRAVANGPVLRDAGGNSQLDTNGDGYGNRCDADFNNNGVVDSQDGALLRVAFGSAGYPDRDLNGNGIVDSQDGALLRVAFGQPPGPSGLVQ